MRYEPPTPAILTHAAVAVPSSVAQRRGRVGVAFGERGTGKRAQGETEMNEVSVAATA